MNHGFSLLELSIVLVIIGLLAGGVMTGQALIRAAELRSVTREIETIRTAVHGFRDKYQALPGDMKSATAFWGVANADPTTCASTRGSGTQTCNGDGDGKIALYYNQPQSNNERFRFWQHLANAGLMQGSYTGVAITGNNFDSDPGVNVLAGKVSTSGYGVEYFGSFGGDAGVFKGDYGNLLNFGAAKVSTTPKGPILMPDEAYSVDVKLDDGKPGYGWIKGPASGFGDAPGCTTSTSPATATYALTSTSKLCMFFITPGF